MTPKISSGFCLRCGLLAAFFFIFFNSNSRADLSFVSSAQFSGPSTGLTAGTTDFKQNCMAKDFSGNIFVAGYSDNGAAKQIIILKYSSELTLLSSATYQGPGGKTMWATGIAADTSGNVIISGTRDNGSNFDYVTFKSSNNLVFISSAVYDGGSNDLAYGVALDAAGNIIVTGSSYRGAAAGLDFFTIKYNSSLVVVSSAATDAGSVFAGRPNVDDEARSVAVDSQQNIIVAGFVADSSGALRDCVVKYDNSFNLLKTATSNLDSGATEEKAFAVAVDPSDNVILAGTTKIGNLDFFIIKYNDSNLTYSLANTARYSGTGDNSDIAYSLAVSSLGNIYVTGTSNDGINYSAVTVKFDNGLNYQTKAALFSSGTNNIGYDVILDSSSHVVISGGSSTDILLTKYSEKNAVTILVNPNAPASAVLTTATGVITVDIPQGAFSQQLYLSLYATGLTPGTNGSVNLTSIGLVVNRSINIQPTKEVNITINFSDSDVQGLDRNRLCVAFFDVSSNRWDALNTTVFPGQNMVVGKTTHFSLFALAENSAGAYTPPIKAYPSPFNPKKSSKPLQIENLPANSKVKIYTFAGSLVKTIDAGNVTAVSWDGKNENGDYVSSGIYLLFADGPSGTKKGKIAIEK